MPSSGSGNAKNGGHPWLRSPNGPDVTPAVALVWPRLGETFGNEHRPGISAVGKNDPHKVAAVGGSIFPSAVDEVVSSRHKHLQSPSSFLPDLLLPIALRLKCFRRIDIQQAPFRASFPARVTVD